MTKKNLATLPEDIYNLFDPNTKHEVNEENIDSMLGELKSLLISNLGGRGDSDHSGLRFSNIGRPDRQLWYTVNGAEREELTPQTYFKFLYGHVIEQLIVFLAKEAGHEVTHEQAEVEVEGIKGHLDCVIDGVTVDVKSAAPFSFQKFENGKLYEDDPFGYIKQLTGYANVVTPDTGAAFLAFNKVSGEICIMNVGQSIVASNKPADRIKYLKEMVVQPTPPERCYEPVADGKSGNMKLPTGCSYCQFKWKCWDNLRGFAYSGGPRFLTRVVKVPDVPEFSE
jgi:hypothetical protein